MKFLGISDTHLLFDDNMIETMGQVGAAGLAAPQVGIGKRIIAYMNNGKPEVLINPIIVAKKRKTPSREKCLSIGKEYFAQRYAYVKVEGLDRNGKSIVVKGKTFLLSVCL